MPKSAALKQAAPQMLSDVVSISRQFLRSVRIDADFGREDGLAGFICQGTARGLLGNMAKQLLESNQRAFTWTGPYGGGKSSLALALCSLVSANANLRAKAREVIGCSDDDQISSAFSTDEQGWLVVPVVGKRADIREAIGMSLDKATGAKKSRHKSSDVIANLVAEAERQPNGVLVVIDELGKLLEATASEGGDIGFLQDLAESASRCRGRLVVVGILHQAFEAYAARLGREAREEWAKVQGRYIDIPLVAGADEVVELVGRAITRDEALDLGPVLKVAARVAECVRARRPGTPATLENSLAACWPLHPVTAALLGPVSRRKFGQNERSTFGFLASREPLGFMEHLAGYAADWASMYGPEAYWDYLRANLEPAILASPDGHRWAQACEAVERAEAKGAAAHVTLTKTVALIELFRAGSGLAADNDVLGASIPGIPEDSLPELLCDLAGWGVMIERKHLGAWGIYAGSDFDIEAAIKTARAEIGEPDLDHISTLSDLQPVLAKRLYHESGTMRWFNRSLARIDGIEQFAKGFKHKSGSVGTFVMCLPSLGMRPAAVESLLREASTATEDTLLLLGTPQNAEQIAELSLELSAAERVLKTRTELEGDAVAKRELVGRIEAIRASLEEELSDAFATCLWFQRGFPANPRRDQPLTVLASNIAQDIYPDTPPVFSELINRDEPSSNSVKARRDLMYRLVGYAGQENLGYEGFPADAGLYFTVLKNLGLHRQLGDGSWGFAGPDHESGNGRLGAWWEASRGQLLGNGKTTSLDSLYAFWAAKPYGLKKGVMPILALAFFMAHRSQLALYVDGVFAPDLSEAVIDEWLLDPTRITLKHVEASDNQAKLLRAVAVAVALNAKSKSTPLDVARALVSVAFELPHWTKRTTAVSQRAQDVRAMLLRASDPNKVLFADLPTLLGTNAPDEIGIRLSAVVTELQGAYGAMLQRVRSHLLEALDHAGRPLGELGLRAQSTKGITGDLRLDAFASRLEQVDDGNLAIEGLISLAVSKPAAQWVDRDIDAAMAALAGWAVDFRRAEAMAPLRNRASSRRVLGVVFGASKGRDATGYVDIADSDTPVVERLVQLFLAETNHERPEVILAALAEAGAMTLSRIENGGEDG